jgi:hypothetical protein
VRLFLWSAVHWSPLTCWLEELLLVDRNRQGCQTRQAQVRLNRVHQALHSMNRARITSSG